MCPALSASHCENQNIKLNKRNKRTITFCRKSVWCVTDFSLVTNDDLQQPEGVNIVLF